MHSPRRPNMIARREFAALSALAGAAAASAAEDLKPLVIRVRALLDQGAHSGKGLSENEIATFKRYQEQARREYAISGIRFDLTMVEGAWLRTQGYSEIPEKFLARRCINLFVTGTLGYDVDRHRTGGSSIGPRPSGPGFAGQPFYKIFLGLRESSDATLTHEYAHHFTLDTSRRPTSAANFWADLRIDYLLWRQRRGVPVMQFRACARSEFASQAATP